MKAWRVTLQALEGVSERYLPFADAATEQLPLGRLVRLGLFQATVGMSMALLAGTVNRVMIVELAVAAGIVGVMLMLPMVSAPLRAVVGHRSDQLHSAFGWRRVPFLWFGTLLQFGGLAILPFGLLLLAEATTPTAQALATSGAAVGFLLVGLGAHTVQTAGLALASDLSTDDQRPRVVAFLYVMLLVGTLVSALAFGALLQDYSHVRLIQVIQGSAVVTLVLNGIALWKQEPRDRVRALEGPRERSSFREAWARFVSGGRASRLLVAVGFGSAGFGMQDVLLEPYGGEVMSMPVGDTSLLTAVAAVGAIGAFGVSAKALSAGFDAVRLSALGCLVGVFAFAAVILAAPLASALLLMTGSALIGFGGGLFTVGTLTEAMRLEKSERNGLAVGAWGGVYASAAGLALAGGAFLRDLVVHAGDAGLLGPALVGPGAGYVIVYHLEIAALFAAMAALGPMAATARSLTADGLRRTPFGLSELPG
jgi:BCD family chlorophyll transporter-like MFS transporter